jgi:predicted nucleic acid-binding protein
MDTMTLEVTMPKDLYVALGFSRGSKAMSSGLVVSNAGPLITLAKIQRSQLLKDLFGRIVIPRAVFEEVVLRGAGQPGAEETRNASWQAGLLDAVKPVLTELQQTDFRASPRVYEEVLARAGES